MSAASVLSSAALALLGIAAVCCLVRAARGPSALDRVVALDVFLVVVAAGVAVRGSADEATLNTAALLAVSLLGFTGSVAAARLVERRHR